MNKTQVKRLVIGASVAAGLAIAATAPRGAEAQKGGSLVIKGSDTLVNLSQAWAEAYMKANPSAKISVTGGGSGVGIAAFLSGQADIANASRPMSGAEIEKSKARGVIPVGTVCALDGLAIAVNSSNPLASLSVPELAKIFAGSANEWSQVGGKSGGKITVLSRESSSGTYVYFRDNVLKGKAYRSDVLLMPSTKAIATEIIKNPNAIGYGGEAYFRGKAGIKVLPISAKEGGEAVMPTDETVQSRKSISRPLFMYTPGKPSGVAGGFIKFCLSDEGQKIVHEIGFTPIK